MPNTLVEPLHAAEGSVVVPAGLKFFQWFEDLCLYACAFLIPLLFCTGTIEVLEFNKQTVFCGLALLMFIAWFGKNIAAKTFSFSRSWLHLAVLLFGIGSFFVSLLSDDCSVSFFGSLGLGSFSFITIVGCILIYYVLANRVRSLTETYNLLFAVFLASLFASLFGLAQMNGWYAFPFAITHSKAFTSIGTSFSLAMFSVATLVMAASLALHGCRDHVCLLGRKGPWGVAARVLVWLTMAANLLVLVCTNHRSAFACLFLGVAFTLIMGFCRSRRVDRPLRLIVPGILIILSVALFFWKTPLALSLPSEVSPNAKTSWEITRQTLQAHPFFGSGPNTWAYDYAKYRSPLVNQTPFWADRFDRGYSTFFTLFATHGLVGMIFWLLLIGLALVQCGILFVKERREDAWFASLSVFSGWFALLATSFFFNFNISHQVLFWILLGLLGGLTATAGTPVEMRRHPWIRQAFVAAFVALAIIGLTGIWLLGQRWAAERVFTTAVNGYAAGGSLTEAMDRVDFARILNPSVDTYWRNLSQAHLLRATQLVQSDKTGEQAQQARTEIASAIDIGKQTVQRFPANEDNWANLAAIYQNVSGMTEHAQTFVAENYEQAHERNPLNPVYAAEVGKAYLQMAEADRAQLEAKDESVRAQASDAMKQHLELAARWLHASAGLKSDYLPAQYYLGIVYERQGQLPEAIHEIESVLSVNNRDVGLAFELSILYYRNNEKARAINLLEQVVRTDPTNANAVWYLSSMYEEQGKIREALQLLQSLGGQWKDNAAIQQRIDHLQQSLQAQIAPPAPALPEPLPMGEPSKPLAPRTRK